MGRIRLGIIGAGHLGSIHARLANELEDFEVTTIVDPNSDSSLALKTQLDAPNVRCVQDHCELIGQVDAAVIATPSTLHHLVGTELLDAGIHILVEKPIALNVSEADDMIAIADNRNVVLQVGHVERFNSAFAAAMAHVEDPVFIEASRCFMHSLRSLDIGVVHDLMIHDIDLTLHIADASLQRVDAAGGTVIGPREDMAQAWLRFTNGVVANLKASRVSSESQRAMTIYCRQKVVNIDFATGHVQVTKLSPRLDGMGLASSGLDLTSLDANGRRMLQEELLREDLQVQTIVAPNGNAIRDELVDFARCIATGATPRVCGRAGRAAVDVAELVCQSVAAFQSSHFTPEEQRPEEQRPEETVWRKAG